MNILCQIKNQADAVTILKTRADFLSNKAKFGFFDNLPELVKQYFYSQGYLPKNATDANNFINSMAGLNSSSNININYALKDVLPPEKYFFLNKDTCVYALYPDVWQKLTIEDRLNCFNFAYKRILEQKNIKQKYRLIWVSPYQVTASGYVEDDKKCIFINLNSLLNTQPHLGLKFYSVLAHEVNHISQEVYTQNLKNNNNLAKTDVYEQSISSNMALTKYLNKNTALVVLDNQHYNQYLSICDTMDWDLFLYKIYLADYKEISSLNVQLKQFNNVANECYSFYGKNPKNDGKIIYYAEWLKNSNVGNMCFENIDDINNLKNLCSGVYNRLLHLNNLLTAIKDNQLPLTQNRKLVFNSIQDEYLKNFKIQKNIYNTLIDIYNNNNKLPDSFNKNLFKLIPHYIKFKDETLQQTLSAHQQIVKHTIKAQNEFTQNQ